MCKQIFAAVIGGDEAKTFCIVEPLNSTRFHLLFPIYLKILGDMPYRSNFKENAYQRYRNLKLESNRRLH